MVIPALGYLVILECLELLRLVTAAILVPVSLDILVCPGPPRLDTAGSLA